MPVPYKEIGIVKSWGRVLRGGLVVEQDDGEDNVDIGDVDLCIAVDDGVVRFIPAAESFWKLLVKALEEAPVKKKLVFFS